MKIMKTAFATIVCAATFGAGAATEANTNQLNALTYNALTYNALTYNALTYNALTYNALTYNGIAINTSRYHPTTGTATTLPVGAIDDKRGERRPYAHPDEPLLVSPLTVIKKEGARRDAPEMPEPNDGAPTQPQLVNVQLGAAALD